MLDSTIKQWVQFSPHNHQTSLAMICLLVVLGYVVKFKIYIITAAWNKFIATLLNHWRVMSSLKDVTTGEQEKENHKSNLKCDTSSAISWPVLTDALFLYNKQSKCFPELVFIPLGDTMSTGEKTLYWEHYKII